MKIGIVTGDGNLRRDLQSVIEEVGHEAIIEDNVSVAFARKLDLLFLQGSGGEDFSKLLKELRVSTSEGSLVPTVVLAPMGAITLMQRARSAGAADVIFLPLEPEEIRAEIEDIGSAHGELDVMYRERFAEVRRKNLIGESRTFLRCLEELKQAARCDANVLLVGETGTGKEMFAHAIHFLSRRSGNPNVAVNCASLPGALLETELFGHIKGAFTGADASRIGRFEAVGAGTLLLDEIGDIEPALQVKLLRVIEQRMFQKLGENKNIQFNARLICATSVDLDSAVNAKRFRHDLLGRIDQLRIELPPLRSRREDIPILARHFLRKHAKGRLVELSKSAMEALDNYDFPMNVRQLENAIVGALARSDPGKMILPKHLPMEITGRVPKGKGRSHSVILSESLTYAEAREHAAHIVDGIFLSRLLRKHGGNQSRAAEEAGIDRKTFAARTEQALHPLEAETHE